jgi:hypothetical protein
MATQVPTSRLLRDNALTITQALPNNTNNTTSYIDIGSGPFNPEEITVEISVPAIPGHTTANNLQIQLWTSATTSGAAVTSPLIECDVLGVTSSGSVATTFRFKLPPGTKRYIAFHSIATTDDCSAATMTITLLV